MVYLLRGDVSVMVIRAPKRISNIATLQEAVDATNSQMGNKTFRKKGIQILF